MRITFLQNNDLLIWSLLYGSSISMKVHTLKQKLWLTYKKEYQTMKKDKDEILKDTKNFIPDNNTLYDLLQDTKVFERLAEDTAKHRMKLIRSWDTYKKEIQEELSDILKVALPDMKVVTLHPAMDQVLTSGETPNIGWGRKKDLEDSLATILNIIATAYLQTLNIEEETEKNIAMAVLELAIKEECYVRIKGQKNRYQTKELASLKEKIYPYFLMYLGYNIEETTKFMMRDNHPFEIEAYQNDEKLRELTIPEFIDRMIEMNQQEKNGTKEIVEIL